MDIETLREHCIKKENVEECFPFDETTLVFKVAGKMFLLVDIDSRPVSFNIKCDPQKAIELREKYSCVEPGWHMNKSHWNTITADGSVNNKLLFSWINDSYDLIVSSLPKKIQATFKGRVKPSK
jgi:predicted DNA-binding protein (MmcQ/YjbR family)